MREDEVKEKKMTQLHALHNLMVPNPPVEMNISIKSAVPKSCTQLLLVGCLFLDVTTEVGVEKEYKGRPDRSLTN